MRRVPEDGSPRLSAISSPRLSSAPGSPLFRWHPYSVSNSRAISVNSATSELSLSSRLDDHCEDLPQDHSAALEMITSLRMERTDVDLQKVVSQLPRSTVLQLVSALEVHPFLVLELCEKDRGNVIAQIMTVVGGDVCSKIVHVMLCAMDQLSVHQCGCIALSRLYDSAAPAQKKQVDLFTTNNFDSLSQHEFGNFVVQRVMDGGDPATLNAIASWLIRDRLLGTLCSNKFGSHVVEGYIKKAPDEAVAPVFECLFHQPHLIQQLSHCRFGNYVLQHALRRIQRVPHLLPLATWCSDTVPSLVNNSPFEINIIRALRHERSGPSVQSPYSQMRVSSF